MDENRIKQIEDFVDSYVEDYEEKYLTFFWGGKFANRITPKVVIYGFSEEKREVLKNTLSFISNNMEVIYENMLKAMLPVLIIWEMQDNRTGEFVTTIEGLEQARDEENFIPGIIINLDDIKDSYAYYSLIFRVDSYRYGYDDGMEVVFYKNKVILFTSGNSWEEVCTFRDYEYSEDCISYFGEDDNVN